MDIFSVAQGKPRPVVTWYKDGQPIDPKMVNIHNSNVDSILFIRSAEREHSGKYELVLHIENMEDRATVEIRIIGKVLLGTSVSTQTVMLLLCPSVSLRTIHLIKHYQKF